MKTPLDLRLPALPPGRFYQLVHHGEIRKKPYSHGKYEVALHFVEKSVESGFRKPASEFLITRLKLSDTYELIRGSLWDSAGHRVSDGQYLTYESTGEVYPIFPHLQSFALGGHRSLAKQLKQVLPAALIATDHSLANSFLATVPETWVIVRQVNNETILLPCFELLRVLYYEAGPELIDHYFAREPLSAICEAINPPSAENGHIGHIRIHRHVGSTYQQCILTELCFNKDYLTTVTATHSRLLAALLQNPKGAYPQMDFYLGHSVQFEANGFRFQLGGKRYFFVCGLWPTETPFSFADFTADLPGRKYSTDSTKKPVDDAGNRATILEPDTRANPPLNSQEAGSRRYQNIRVNLHARQGFEWPVGKASKAKSYDSISRTPSRRIERAPESLSHEGGGIDDTRAAVQTNLAEESDQAVQLTTYFQEFIDWLKQFDSYTIELLTIYNEAGVHGANISLLGEKDSRKLGIAQIKYDDRYYYFIELIGGGRAAFIHKKSLHQMNTDDFDSLFSTYKTNSLDWSKCKKLLLEQDNNPGTTGELSAYSIHPRNHYNGGAAAARLCHRVMTG